MEPSKGNFSVEYLPTFAAVFSFSVLIYMRLQSHIINPSNDSLQPSASATTPIVAEPSLQAVNKLANKFNQHMALMDQRLSQQEAQLNAISQPPAQSNYRTFNNLNRFRRGPTEAQELSNHASKPQMQVQLSPQTQGRSLATSVDL